MSGKEAFAYLWFELAMGAVRTVCLLALSSGSGKWYSAPDLSSPGRAGTQH